MKVTDEMVNRFLSWPLPASVRSDDCATVQGYPHRSGTTLLTADEARQMLEHVLQDGAALTEAVRSEARWTPVAKEIADMRINEVAGDLPIFAQDESGQWYRLDCAPRFGRAV